MISIRDKVFAHEVDPSPSVPADWKPTPEDRKAGARQVNVIKIVAAALAKAKQEKHPDAWLHYLGMAVTWLNEHKAEDRLEVVRLAAHKTKFAHHRRTEV